MKDNGKTHALILIVLFGTLALAVIISFLLGRYDMTLKQFFQTLFSHFTGITPDPVMEKVIFQTRFPRILVAIIIGGGLSISGAAYQGTFRNPMVSPDLLGASAGAGFGAAMAILLSFNHFGIQAMAFLFSILAVFLSYGISSAISRTGSNVLSLVLTGMVVSALFQAFISIIKYLADPHAILPAITFWLMGGLASVLNSELLILLIPVLIGAVPLFLLRWRMNALSFGDEEARMLGIHPQRMRIIIILCSTLITAACVAVGGMISWVGLIIPHLARMIVGPNYRKQLPASCLLGSIFLLIVDDVARCLTASEIPISILTAVIGAPFFLYLLFRGRKSWL
ncbi:MAG: iron ABC transporter permease [Bacillota bacterium]